MSKQPLLCYQSSVSLATIRGTTLTYTPPVYTTPVQVGYTRGGPGAVPEGYITTCLHFCQHTCMQAGGTANPIITITQGFRKTARFLKNGPETWEGWFQRFISWYRETMHPSVQQSYRCKNVLIETQSWNIETQSWLWSIHLFSAVKCNFTLILSDRRVILVAFQLSYLIKTFLLP